MSDWAANDAMRKAADRLHHLSMRYAGALQELVSGEPVTFIPTGAPGLKESRDFIDLILFTRAEINGLTKLLLDAGVVTAAQVERTFAEEYAHFAAAKAGYLGVEVTDHGLVFRRPDPAPETPP